MSDTPNVPDPDDDESNEYDLIYPFVVCASNGGPFDDDAYTAGVEFGTIAAKLAAAPTECTEMKFTVRSENVRQLDLAAAHHHWNLTVLEWDSDPSWTFAHFRRVWAR